MRRMTDLPSSLSNALEAGERAVAVDAAVIAKLTEMAGDFAINLTVAAIIFALTLVAARWASGAARKLLGRTKAVRRDPTVLAFMVQIVRVVVIIIGMIAVLQRLGVQTTSIIAVLGAASLAIGLALQGALSNVAAGVMILLFRPYRVGDVIEIDAKDNYLRAGEGKRVAVVGVSDLIVVTHGDDIVVIPRDRAQEVKAIVEYLAANSPRER